MKLWDAQTGTPVLDLKGASSNVVFSPDRTRFLMTDNGTLKVRDAKTGARSRSQGTYGLRGEPRSSPDGSRIVTGSQDHTVKVWDAQAGMPRLQLQGHRECLTSVAFSPDGKRIVTGSIDATAKIWDAQTGAPMLELQGNTGGVWSVAFSPDGTRIVTGISFSSHARVWDALTGAALLNLKGHGKEVGRAFSPDGTRLATGSFDRTAEGFGRTDRHAPTRIQSPDGSRKQRVIQSGRDAARDRKQ